MSQRSKHHSVGWSGALLWVYVYLLYRAWHSKSVPQLYAVGTLCRAFSVPLCHRALNLFYYISGKYNFTAFFLIKISKSLINYVRQSVRHSSNLHSSILSGNNTGYASGAFCNIILTLYLYISRPKKTYELIKFLWFFLMNNLKPMAGSWFLDRYNEIRRVLRFWTADSHLVCNVFYTVLNILFYVHFVLFFNHIMYITFLLANSML